MSALFRRACYVRRAMLTKIKSFRSRRRALRKFEDLAASGVPITLDLGSGGPGRESSYGVDLSPNADIVYDLTEGIPLPTNSVSAIFSDHFFEHLPLPQVFELLKECHRVLVPDGVLRFTVPHINPYLDAYINGDMEFLRAKISDIPSSNAELYATPFDRLSWLLHRDGEHKSLFDRDSILHKVKIAGFSQAESGGFDPERDINFRFSSIYVEARK